MPGYIYSATRMLLIFANHLAEAQMCVFFGWIVGTKIVRRYIHLSGRDVDNALIALNERGQVKVEDDYKIKPSTSNAYSFIDHSCSFLAIVLNAHPLLWQTGKFITKWGSPGSGDGQFNSPTGIRTDSAGNVYVADFDNNRVQKFDSNGKFITKWGIPSSP